MDLRKIKKLIEMVEESDIEEIEITMGDENVRIKRASSMPMISADRMVYPQEPATTPVNAATQGRGSAARPDANEEASPATDKSSQPPIRGHIIRAPMVGTTYQAPSPGSPAFVKVGQQVKSGDVLCIIESMKMMNHIESDKSGVIEAILVENGQPVEYDQPMFTIV